MDLLFTYEKMCASQQKKKYNRRLCILHINMHIYRRLKVNSFKGLMIHLNICRDGKDICILIENAVVMYSYTLKIILHVERMHYVPATKNI